MIDTKATVASLLQAAQAQPDAMRASRALDPLLQSLRARVVAERVDAAASPMIRTWSPPGVRAGERPEETAARLAFRLDEVVLAKRFGDGADVQRVLDTTLRELREAALGSTGFRGA